MTVSTWTPFGSSLYKGIDPQAVADEIISIGDEATPQQIVDKARDESTTLHRCFIWDDYKAAELYRLAQARTIVCNLVIKRPESEEEQPKVRYFYKTESSQGYKPSTYIFHVPDEYEKLLKQAYAELHAFKQKYNSLKELEQILELID